MTRTIFFVYMSSPFFSEFYFLFPTSPECQLKTNLSKTNLLNWLFVSIEILFIYIGPRINVHISSICINIRFHRRCSFWYLIMLIYGGHEYLSFIYSFIIACFLTKFYSSVNSLNWRLIGFIFNVIQHLYIQIFSFWILCSLVYNIIMVIYYIFPFSDRKQQWPTRVYQKLHSRGKICYDFLIKW